MNQDMEFLDDFNTSYPLPQHEVRRDEIGGLDELIDSLQTFKRAIEYPRLYEFFGVSPAKGFMLSGPPGYGKTYMAKYLAKDLGARFMDIPLSKFESKWVGQSSQQLTKIINDARYYKLVTGQHVLLFFDEAEEAFKDRRLMGWHGPRVNVLLREMDGLTESNDGLFFGAATNHLEQVDPAIMRPGRLDYHLEIKEYSVTGLADVVRATMTQFNRKAKYTDPFFISDLEIYKIGEFANENKLTPAHINEAFKRATDGKIKELIECTDKIYWKNFNIYSEKVIEHLEDLCSRDVRRLERRPIGFKIK